MLRREFLALAALPAAHVPNSRKRSDLASQSALWTPNREFFIRNHWDVPDTAVGIVRIDGLVDRPVTLRMDSLAQMGSKKIGAVLECAGNLVETSGLVSCGDWEGVALGDLLPKAGPRAGASWMSLFGRDGFSRCVPLDRALARGLLATHCNGAPLALNHGAPVRALFPGWYGMDAVKWLERIEVSNSSRENAGAAYHTALLSPSGHVVRGELPAIQVKSILTAPKKGARLPLGTTAVRGLAWAGDAGVSGVEVSADGGSSWHAASLADAAGFAWRAWQAMLPIVQAGVVELVCRATDGNGATQPAHRDPARRDLYANNWYHCVRCVVGDA